MAKFYLVKGKKGVLVASPWRPHGFIGQQLKTWDGDMPKRMSDRFEPAEEVIPKHVHLTKVFNRGDLEILKTIEADNIQEARKHGPQSVEPKPRAKKAEPVKKASAGDEA